MAVGGAVRHRRPGRHGQRQIQQHRDGHRIGQKTLVRVSLRVRDIQRLPHDQARVCDRAQQQPGSRAVRVQVPLGGVDGHNSGVRRRAMGARRRVHDVRPFHLV